MTDRSALPEARLAARLRLAQAVLLWERIWPECWPAVVVLGTFFVLALFDLLPDLPGRWHGAILLGFGAALMIAARRAIERFVSPDFGAARRLGFGARREEDGALHRERARAPGDRTVLDAM